MLVTAALCLLFLVGALAARARRGWFHPATLCLSAWSAATGLLALLPLGVARLNGTAALVLLLGVFSLATGALIGADLRPPSAMRGSPGRRPTLATVIPVAAVVSLVLVLGLLRFRAQVTAATGAGSFGELSATQVRFATVYGEAAKGGIGSLMMSVAPVLAALGIMATALTRWSWLLVGVALYATAQNPGRTFTLTVVATAAAFFAYLWPQRQVKLPWHGRPSRRRLVVMAALVIVGSGAYFQTVGNSLGKSDLAIPEGASPALPRSVVPAAVYAVGGMSALAVSTSTGTDPTVGEHGRSVYLLPRLAHVLDPETHAPDTVAKFVDIPVPFNVYTGFGDLYFDFGYTGVIGIGLLIGLLLGLVHARARAPGASPAWAFCSALGISLMVSMLISFRVLYLDSVVQLAVGALGFWLIDRLGKARAREPLNAGA